MSKNIYTYKQWAPEDSRWASWAKPVLFATLSTNDFEERKMRNQHRPRWLDFVDGRTAIILDLPGKEGIETALMLAKEGLRPVPLYNGCKGITGNGMLVDVREITHLLYSGAKILETLSIRNDATPVFMLDSRRMSGYGKAPGKYDNRWCVFAQDMPSAKYLKENGIDKVLVYAYNELIAADLSHVLFRYQQEHIQIQSVKGDWSIEDIKVHKPSRFKSLLYRYSVHLGLRRNSTGGFGGVIPEPMEHHAGVGYRGIG